MNPQSDEFWWLPVLSRIVRWSLSLAVLCAALSCLFLFGLVNSPPLRFWRFPGYTSIFWPTMAWWWKEMLTVLLLYTAPVWLSGLITGALCGFYAPPTEPRNPFRSRWVRVIVGRTYGWTLLAGVPLALTLQFAPAFPYLWFARSVLAMLAVFVVCFGFSLYFALNRALARRDTS